MNTLAGRLIGIALCGMLGALAGWGLVVLAALEGVLGALAAAGVGMVTATAGFVGWTTLGARATRAK